MFRTHAAATVAAVEKRQSLTGNQNARSMNLSARTSGLQSIETIPELTNSKFNNKEDCKPVSASATGSSRRDILISRFDLREDCRK